MWNNIKIKENKREKDHEYKETKENDVNITNIMRKYIIGFSPIWGKSYAMEQSLLIRKMLCLFIIFYF